MDEGFIDSLLDLLETKFEVLHAEALKSLYDIATSKGKKRNLNHFAFYHVDLNL